MTAAVADFTPATKAANKMKREGALTLELVPTADILAELGSRRAPGQLLVGFAAETEDVVAHARGKLERKHLDAIVCNDVSRPGIGFGSDRNAGRILTADDDIEIPEMSKLEMAGCILDAIAALRSRGRR